MKVDVKQVDVTKFSTPLLVVNLFKGVSNPGGATGAVDQALDGAISTAIAAGEIKGKLGETLLFRSNGKIPAQRVLLVGLGEAEKFGPEEIRTAAAAAIWAAEKISVKEMGTIVHGAGIGGLDPQFAAENTCLGSLLAEYRFDLYKSEETKSQSTIQSLTIIENDESKISSIKIGVERADKIAWAQNIARDFISEPSNVLTPVEFADRVQKLGKEANLKVEVYDERWIQDKGMNLMWGVAKGSHNMPRMIVMRHQGAGEKEPWIGMVGKGVMFDSGGISLKPGQGMEAMKGDMGGGAAVVAAMLAISRLGVKKNVLGIVPSVFNSPGGAAQNPGDVVKGLDGPTVEIVNTDAEGRLILADGLSYARELGASYLIDIATLTGASVVALGNKVAGLFPTDDKMRDLFVANVAETGEKLWPMPMFDDYAKLLESGTAVIKNTGGRGAGSITAAKFLEYFTDSKPWVHIDIAAKESTCEQFSCYRKGATGFGVRTLIRFVETWNA